jgi:hypothetical protein
MSSEQPIVSVPAGVRSCPRCGKPVRAVELITECPHCGYEVRNPRPVPLAETIIHGDGSTSSAELLSSFPETIHPVQPVAEQVVTHDDPLIGTDIDVYRVDALLGRGGMGLVYLAHHRAPFLRPQGFAAATGGRRSRLRRSFPK